VARRGTLFFAGKTVMSEPSRLIPWDPRNRHSWNRHNWSLYNVYWVLPPAWNNYIINAYYQIARENRGGLLHALTAIDARFREFSVKQ